MKPDIQLLLLIPACVFAFGIISWVLVDGSALEGLRRYLEYRRIKRELDSRRRRVEFRRIYKHWNG